MKDLQVLKPSDPTIEKHFSEALHIIGQKNHFSYVMCYK